MLRSFWRCSAASAACFTQGTTNTSNGRPVARGGALTVPSFGSIVVVRTYCTPSDSARSTMTETPSSSFSSSPHSTISLHDACWEGDLVEVQRLLGTGEGGGGNPTMLGNSTASKALGSTVERSPLHCAVVQGKVEVVRTLLGIKKVDVNQPDSNRDTALHLATQDNNIALMRLLLGCSSKRLNVNAEDKYGCTPLHYACFDGAAEIVRLLLVKGKANPSLLNDDKRTPLHEACSGGVSSKEAGGDPTTSRRNIVRLLLEHGAKTYYKAGDDGRTALHIACTDGGDLDVVKLLLKFDADPWLKDGCEMTPLDLAEQERKEMMETVKKNRRDAGVDVVATVTSEPSSSSSSSSSSSFSTIGHGTSSKTDEERAIEEAESRMDQVVMALQTATVIGFKNRNKWKGHRK